MLRLPGSPILRVVLRVAIVVAVVVALIAVEISSRYGVWWRLITFTYQANVLAAAYYVWTLASPRADARVGLRGAVVLYVVIAGVIWNVFLTGYSMGYTAANILLHVVVPILALTDWLLVGRGQGLVRWWQPVAWLVYPAAYAGPGAAGAQQRGPACAVLLPRSRQRGDGHRIGNICVLTACVLAVGYTLLAVNRVSDTGPNRRFLKRSVLRVRLLVVAQYNMADDMRRHVWPCGSPGIR